MSTGLDIISWSSEQAAYLRTKQFDKLDIENLAEEIEDMGKSEQREFESRMAVLLAHLLKWEHQPALRSRSWENTIKHQRYRLKRRLEKTPSLKASLNSDEFWTDVWEEATFFAEKETGLSSFPETCGWDVNQILDNSFYPG
jgi:Domain of unknown function DUF29